LLAGIDRRRISSLLSQVADDHGRIAANRVRASLSAFFAWAIREGMLDLNPAIGTNRADEVARDRVLSLEELREILDALRYDHYGATVKLLILTGQRRDEIGALRWSVGLSMNGRSGSRRRRSHTCSVARRRSPCVHRGACLTMRGSSTIGSLASASRTSLLY